MFGRAEYSSVFSPGLSPYRQRPLAGMLRAYVFNGSRRTMQQLPYVAPPLMFCTLFPSRTGCCTFFARAPSTFLTLTIIIVYGVYYWAKTKYDYYNSKQGHFDHLIEEGVIKPGQYERPTVGPVVH